MVRFTTTCIFVFIILIVNESQKCYCPRGGGTSCANQIRTVFQAFELKDPYKASIKFLAANALKYLRMSDNSLIDSFTLAIGSGNRLNEHAKDYYLLLRQYITVGSKMLPPITYCQNRHKEVNQAPYVFIDPDADFDPNAILSPINAHVYTACLMQLNAIGIKKDDEAPDVLFKLYDTVDIRTFGTLQHAKVYVEEIADTFKLTVSPRDIKTPAQFCSDRH